MPVRWQEIETPVRSQPSGSSRTSVSGLAVFAVFCSKLTAIGISFSAETLDCDGSENGRTVKCLLFCRCFLLFLGTNTKVGKIPFPRYLYSGTLSEMRISQTSRLVN
jgi:hypothetical protein